MNAGFPDLLDKLRDELPGILRWAVGGYAAYRDRGLEPPAEVTGATEDYRLEMDIIGNFIADSCDLSDELSASPTDLYQASTKPSLSTPDAMNG